MNGHTCELCGQPATDIVVDAEDITLPTDPARRYRPHGKHYFCALHSRESITYPAKTPATEDRRDRKTADDTDQ